MWDKNVDDAMQISENVASHSLEAVNGSARSLFAGDQ